MEWLQNQVTISLLEVTIGSVKPLHELQVDLRLMKINPNDFS